MTIEWNGRRADATTKAQDTHCLAARIICAFRSWRLASRFAAVSSHWALPSFAPFCGVSGASETKESTLCWRLYREMRDSEAFGNADDDAAGAPPRA